MVVGSTKLPRYVLRVGGKPACLSLSAGSTSPGVSAILGFSDKPQYDQYLTHCSKLLTPYPLVKGYLKNQIEASPETLQLVILDAGSPHQDRLEAATMEAIFEALNRNLEMIEISHHLQFDPTTATYQLLVINAPSTDKVPH